MYEWYYVGQYGQLGPLSLEQMAELVEGQVILADTYVWRKGMSEWVLAASVPELNVRLPHAGPPPFPGVPTQLPNRFGAAAIDRSVVSPCSRTLAGILNIIFPGIGRMYLGYLAIGLLQFVLTVCTFGVFYLWSFVDGILILTGNVHLDGYGRALRE